MANRKAGGVSKYRNQAGIVEHKMWRQVLGKVSHTRRNGGNRRQRMVTIVINLL